MNTSDACHCRAREVEHIPVLLSFYPSARTEAPKGRDGMEGDSDVPEFLHGRIFTPNYYMKEK